MQTDNTVWTLFILKTYYNILNSYFVFINFLAVNHFNILSGTLVRKMKYFMTKKQHTQTKPQYGINQQIHKTLFSKIQHRSSVIREYCYLVRGKTDNGAWKLTQDVTFSGRHWPLRLQCEVFHWLGSMKVIFKVWSVAIPVKNQTIYTELPVPYKTGPQKVK